jgi:hypothetical protein
MPDSISLSDEMGSAEFLLQFAHVQVTVLECVGSALMVRWVEHGVRHYGEQYWRRGVATRRGICVLSRKHIKRGDEIFRPAGRPRPANFSAMILAIEVLDRLPA